MRDKDEGMIVPGGVGGKGNTPVSTGCVQNATEGKRNLLRVELENNCDG